MIFQMHPDHGRHFAASQQEADDNEKNGWRTVKREEFYGEAENNTPKGEVTESEDDLVAQYVEKFGVKPHHKMKPETIRAKLDE